uniref:Thioredoxin-like fold domain-containing protein n=1 Tax=Sus scrofa TaxID=9823 RepID=A0A8D0PV17_PIG
MPLFQPEVSRNGPAVDVLGGRCLVTCDGAWVEAETALQNKVVALYFAAGRCAPSRDFTPLLCDFYAELVDEAQPPAPFEVVFVSADGSAQEMLDFMRELHGAWLALPFHDPYRHYIVVSASASQGGFAVGGRGTSASKSRGWSGGGCVRSLVTLDPSFWLVGSEAPGI